MKLTRRTFIKVAGAAGVAGSVGCGDAGEAELEPTEEFDSPPDEMLDADTDDLDAGAGDLDAAVDEDAATGDDGAAPGLDASTDAGPDVPVDPPRDAGVEPPPDVPVTPPRDVPVTPPRDVPVTPPRVDAGRDAGAPPLARPDFRDLPERRTQFPLGVMAGDATDTSVMFWTKYSGDASVVLRVLEMDGNRIAAVRFNGRVTPSGGGFVRAVVTGLRPNRRHLYAFLLGGATSPTGRSLIGRVQTALGADSLAPIVFGGTSCSSPRAHPFPVLQDAGSRDDLDFFIHAGDHIYADLLGNAVSISQYRAKYSESWSSSGMRSLHGSTGQYLTWDDHEVFNNWNPETVSGLRLAAARQAFFEHRATRRNADDRDRIWRSFRWGRTAEVFILDCRGERRPSTRSEDPSRSSTYISRRQMDTAEVRAALLALRVQVHRQLGAHR
jgi:alkaline phosphatase D